MVFGCESLLILTKCSSHFSQDFLRLVSAFVTRVLDKVNMENEQQRAKGIINCLGLSDADLRIEFRGSKKRFLDKNDFRRQYIPCSDSGIHSLSLTTFPKSLESTF